jgi:signal peptidase I
MEVGLKVSVKKEIWEWTKSIVIAVVVVVGLRRGIVDHYKVDGSSMEPTIHNGERVIVNKILYKFSHPQRGDIVILHAPEGKDYIKRVVGLPGEKVEVKGDVVKINGKKIDEPYLAAAIKKAKKQGFSYNNFDYPFTEYDNNTVPKDSLFVMGDNRSFSKDSRSIGFIKYDKIVGRADVIFWPIPNFEIVSHNK